MPKYWEKKFSALGDGERKREERKIDRKLVIKQCPATHCKRTQAAWANSPGTGLVQAGATKHWPRQLAQQV